VFLMPLAAAAGDHALSAQKALRAAGVRTVLDHEGRSFKSRMKLADKLGARFVAILGDDELAQGAWMLRDMKTSSQQPVPLPALVDHLKGRL
jgi:histidyl-tRNA synthetase